MLTKTDLSQIRKIVREEVTIEVKNAREELQAEIKFARMETINEISRLDNRVKNLEIRLSQFQAETEKNFKQIKINIRQLRKDLNAFTNSFDTDRARLQKRVARIETHLSLSTP